MKSSEIRKKYNRKINEYKKHSHLYYNESNPTITDSQFDKLKKEIIELEKKHKFLRSNNSPTKSIGSIPSKNFEKYKHKVPMLSLSNAFDKDDLINFEKKIFNYLNTKKK